MYSLFAWYVASLSSLPLFNFPSFLLLDLSTCSSWFAKSSVFHNICPIGIVLGRNILSGKSSVLYLLLSVCSFRCLFEFFFFKLNWNDWQAHAVCTDGLRSSFYIINVVVYAMQVILVWKEALLMILFCCWGGNWAIFFEYSIAENHLYFYLLGHTLLTLAED